MKFFERNEMMRYLTRPATPKTLPQDTGNRGLELAEGGVVDRENYKLGSDFIKDIYKANEIPGVRVRKEVSGNIYIAGRYTDKDGQRITTGAKTFDPKTATQKEVTDFLNQTKKQLKGKTYSSTTEVLADVNKIKTEYTDLKKKYTTELMEWLDEASKNPKYKTKEQIQKDLFKQFDQPKYTQVPKGVDPKNIFIKDNKFYIPREMEIFGRKVGSNKVPEKIIDDLTNFFLLKNNPNFEKVRDVAYGFFTQNKADINKYPVEQQKILRNFSKDFIKGQFKGEAGESIFLSGLKQEGFNFNNKVNEILYIQSLKDKITKELSNPNISNNRKIFLNKQLETINYQKTNITNNLTKLHPNLFRAAKNPGNLVYEHKVPRFIQDMVNLPYDYLARASFAPNAFNVYKFEQFDKPLGKLITEYNSTNDVTVKNEIKNKIEDLKNTFNKKTKVNGQGYLDEVEFKFGNKVKLIDNTPLISDLTNKNVYENILRNVNHSNKFFEKEGLNKYVVKGKDFENYTKDLQNRISNKSLKLYSGFAMLEDIADPALKRLEPFFKGGLDFAKTVIKSPLAKGVGKFVGGEIAAAPFFSALDYGAGLEPSEIALNIPTLGLGTTAKDYGTAVLNLPKKQQERLGEIFSQETTLPEVDENIVKNISKTYEDLEKKRAKVAESRIQPPGSFEEPFIPLEPLINKQEVKDDLYIPSLPKKNLVEKEGILNLAIGGRVGFKDGPKDPSKRKFIKGAGITGAAIGILNLAPDLFKALKKTKTAVKLLPKAAGMPEWFNPLVAKIMKEGVDISPKATRVEDIIKVKKLEIKSPDGKGTDTIIMTEYPNGTIEVDAEVLGGGAFDSPFTLTYKPPKSDINLETGKEIKDPGSFYVVEQRPKPDYNDPGNFEIDYETMYIDDAISDIERIEKIATGKITSPQKVEQRTGARKFVESNPSEDIVNRYGDAEIEYDRMKDEGLLDD